MFKNIPIYMDNFILIHFSAKYFWTGNKQNCKKPLYSNY